MSVIPKVLCLVLSFMLTVCTVAMGQRTTTSLGLPVAQPPIMKRVTRASKPAVPYASPVSLASWTPLGELDPRALDYAEQFGRSVSVSGKVVVVGSPSDSSRIGAAYVYVVPSHPLEHVLETAKLTASDGQANDYFGDSVSISGDTIVVGAPGANSGQGKVYVFVKPPSGWSTVRATTNSGSRPLLTAAP
jgi:hypothetical protein